MMTMRLKVGGGIRAGPLSYSLGMQYPKAIEGVAKPSNPVGDTKVQLRVGCQRTNKPQLLVRKKRSP